MMADDISAPRAQQANTQQDEMACEPLRSNLRALRNHHPEMASVLDGVPDLDTITLYKTPDGGLAYLRKTDRGHVPLTNPRNPTQATGALLQQNASAFANTGRPILMVGLYPGDELLYLFERGEAAIGRNQPPQQIWLCIDSPHHLWGFLSACDATELLAAERFHPFLAANACAVAQQFGDHPEWGHRLTLLSQAPAETINRVMPGFVQLMQQRKAELPKLLQTNNDYYDRLSDAELSAAIVRASSSSDASSSATRKAGPPRLMLPTAAWSTVTQYSSRDTAAVFRDIGWDVEVLNIETELTPYYLASRINAFKPDVLIFINHLRTEAIDAYPRNLMFVTWIQDALPHVNRKDAAEMWNETVAAQNRDLIIGYTNQLKPYGYSKNRLTEIPMIVNTRLFRPREINEEQKAKYGCDVMFASRSGHPTQLRIDELETEFSNTCAPPCPRNIIQDVHDHLWEQYRAQNSFTNYSQLQQELLTLESFCGWFSCLSNDDKSSVTERIFWRLNDIIYRQAVIEWIADHADITPGFKLHLYGEGWETHPRFAEFAKPSIEHGEELSIAYQAAGRCLHLNSTEGDHQRQREIIASGAVHLSRHTRCSNLPSADLRSALRRLAISREEGKPPILKEWTVQELEAFTDWLFRTAQRHLKEAGAISKSEVRLEVAAQVDLQLVRLATRQPDDGRETSFRTREELEHTLACSPPKQSVLTETNFMASQTVCQMMFAARHLLAPETVDAYVPGEIPEMSVVLDFAYALNASGESQESANEAFSRIQHPGPTLRLAWIDRLGNFEDRKAVIGLLAAAGEYTRLTDELESLSKTSSDHLVSEVVRGLYTTHSSLTDINSCVAAALVTASPDSEGTFNSALDLVRSAYEQGNSLADGLAAIAWKRFVPGVGAYDRTLAFLAEDHEQGRLSRQMQLNYATALAASGMLDKALEMVARLYEEDPSLEDGYSRVGWYFHVPGDMRHDLAIPYFALDKKLARISPVMSLNHAVVLAAEGRWDEATQLVTEAYADNARVADGWCRIGWYRFIAGNGQIQDTIEYFERDARAGRISEEWCIYHACALTGVGEDRRARTLLDEVYTTSPTACAGRLLTTIFRTDATSQEIVQAGELDLQDRRMPPSLKLLHAYFQWGLGDKAHATALGSAAVGASKLVARWFLSYAWMCRISRSAAATFLEVVGIPTPEMRNPQKPEDLE